jgi:hypothetical protein
LIDGGSGSVLVLAASTLVGLLLVVAGPATWFGRQRRHSAITLTHDPGEDAHRSADAPAASGVSVGRG